jgi:hypothetical protein
MCVYQYKVCEEEEGSARGGSTTAQEPMPLGLNHVCFAEGYEDFTKAHREIVRTVCYEERVRFSYCMVDHWLITWQILATVLGLFEIEIHQKLNKGLFMHVAMPLLMKQCT